MRVSVLILDDVIDVGLASILDAFETANHLGSSVSGEMPFEIQLIGIKCSVATHQGLQLTLGRARNSSVPEILIIPALASKTPDTLVPALARYDVRAAGEFAVKCSDGGAVVATACTGTFILAEARMLDDRRATTTWWLAPMFRKRYPRVRLDDALMVVQSKGVVTAGAALGHLDLALSLIREHRPALATLVARYLVIEPHHSQAFFAIADQLAHEDLIAENFEKWAREHLSETFSLPAAARSISVSERTLARRVHAALGKSPLQYVQSIRVERAMHQIRCTNASIEEIASSVGYSNGNTLRTLIRRQTGLTVRHIRALENVMNDKAH